MVGYKQKGLTMKLASLNISIKVDNTKEVINFLDEQKSDIIALQESLRHFNDSVFEKNKTAHDIEKAFEQTHPYSFFAPIWVSKNITKGDEVYLDFGGLVEQGTQIISKFPIKFASNNFYYNDYFYGFDATEFKTKDWSRSIQLTILNIEGKPLKIINVHGIWNETRMGDKRTMHQCQFILDEALKDDMPTIIAGDFNLLPESESIGILNEKLRNLITEYKVTKTRPEFDDGLDTGGVVVDYIFVNDKVKVNDFKMIETDISDHFPLVLDFDI